MVRSQDLTAAVLLLAGLLLLDIMGRGLLHRLFNVTTFCLSDGEIVRPGEMQTLANQVLGEAFFMVLPFFLVLFVAAALVALLQTGWLFTWTPVKPDLNKINPVSGFKRLFSMHMITQSGINMGKLIVVGAVAYSAIHGQITKILFAATMSYLELTALGVEIFFVLGLRVAIALIILGIIDWMYQRHRHTKNLRMSKQEVKDEMKRMEGDPVMKRRRRQTQMTLAMQRLRKDVPEADVVVTNPTHYSVALKYDEATMSAPRVVAKGEGYVALRIREVAVASGVPVIERKPLARALYRLAEVGQEVPPQLYQAVAEILAYVYQLSGRRAATA